MPQAKSLIYDNPDVEIKGYILETTWRVQLMYVISILTSCFLNTSLPIGFTFSTGKTKHNYNYLITILENEISIDFLLQVIERNQGKALIGLYIDRSIIHFKCLGHLLAGLKYDKIFL